MSLSLSCTKGTTIHCQTVPSLLPTNIRKLSWSDVYLHDKKYLGEGVFGKCYCVTLGSLKTCLKVFRNEKKYANLLYNEVRILSQLCHENLPWIFGVCYDVENPKAIVMSHHPFCGKQKSLTIYGAIKFKEMSNKVTMDCWRKILVGCTAALIYLQQKNLLHNDLKSDNIIIEYLPPNYEFCRSIVIDFGKACYSHEAKLYHLSSEQKLAYKTNHPQIAPEVRTGINKQSFASDIYSFGRILQKINSAILNTPVLYNLAEQCLDHYSKRPTADELNTFLSNLFSNSHI